MASQEEQAKQMGQIIAKCWSDDSFKQKLMSDPSAVLKEMGVDIPEGLEVKTLENTDKVFHLVIPPKPDELSDEDLDKVAGGGWHMTDANKGCSLPPNYSSAGEGKCHL